MKRGVQGLTEKTTCAPSSKKRSAVARPIPDVAPGSTEGGGAGRVGVSGRTPETERKKKQRTGHRHARGRTRDEDALALKRIVAQQIQAPAARPRDGV